MQFDYGKKMKTFILVCLLSLWSSFSPAQGKQVSSNVSFAFEEEQNIQDITLANFIETILEIGNHFDKNYPENAIDSDLKPDIEKFFPESTRQQLYDKEDFIRNSVKLSLRGRNPFYHVRGPRLP